MCIRDRGAGSGRGCTPRAVKEGVGQVAQTVGQETLVVLVLAQGRPVAHCPEETDKLFKAIQTRSKVAAAPRPCGNGETIKLLVF